MAERQLSQPIEYAGARNTPSLGRLILPIMCSGLAAAGEYLLWNGNFANENIALPLSAISIIIGLSILGLASSVARFISMRKITKLALLPLLANVITSAAFLVMAVLFCRHLPVS